MKDFIFVWQENGSSVLIYFLLLQNGRFFLIKFYCNYHKYQNTGLKREKKERREQKKTRGKRRVKEKERGRETRRERKREGRKRRREMMRKM